MDRECEMDTIKPTSGPNSISAQPNAERRSFMWKIGAALSAVVATAAACTSKREAELKEQVERMSNQLGMLEDTNAIRKRTCSSLKLHRLRNNRTSQGVRYSLLIATPR